MSQKEQDQTDIAQQEKKTLQVIITSVKFIIPMVLAVLLLTYFLNFNGSFGNQGDFGAFGDFIGGILNPILTFLTIVILVYSIRLQVKELELTRNEIKETKDIHRDNLLLAHENLKAQEKQYALEVLTEKIKSKLVRIDELLLSDIQAENLSKTIDLASVGETDKVQIKLPSNLKQLNKNTPERTLRYFESDYLQDYYFHMSINLRLMVSPIEDIDDCIAYLDSMKMDRILLDDVSLNKLFVDIKVLCMTVRLVVDWELAKPRKTVEINKHIRGLHDHLKALEVSIDNLQERLNPTPKPPHMKSTPFKVD
ncbi:hypothetical protein L1077_24155 [Pseudoalteromonas luteoviolacea]|uniref:hypothetical protein n=1 Tax=Pseudoalteromonas luteoviolacea TaxID=43657 RepID=UPI001F303A78|nr:hypothetical protein [Pseudoalteromonas luteoviolacea]MCF6442526.1 hypothetical protein [Pseudoalteromonas luteoviolacea]